jgi:DNA-binding GntR family transcriptional regulator
MNTIAPDAAVARAAPSDAEMHGRLFEALLDQRLAPGTRLREDDLASAFGVSRTRIRQLLIRLAGDGLVTLVPNAGARVAEPSADEAREVFAARRLIEPALLAGFAARAFGEALVGLTGYIDAEEAARAGGQRHEAIRMAGRFHLCIAEHAGNATLAAFLRNLVSRTSLVLMRWGPQEIRDEGCGACDCVDHRRIVAALRLKDAGAAGEAMLAHLDGLERQLDFAAAREPRQGLAKVLGL